ncbi:hypothetical protein [Parasphingorhabdus sp.]|uniref:hypothetical protein n=1 Tax=Parasphingorhabdus sp. TaxID=2709688 RepID=UPI003263252C
MMENLQKRGEALAEKRLLDTRSEIKSALAAELPGDVEIIETAEGVELKARRLSERLIENSSLRDVAFLMRAVR